MLGFPLGGPRLEPWFDSFSSFRLALSSRFRLQRPSSCRARSPLVKNHACLRVDVYITSLWFLLGLCKRDAFVWWLTWYAGLHLLHLLSHCYFSNNNPPDISTNHKQALKKEKWFLGVCAALGSASELCGVPRRIPKSLRYASNPTQMLIWAVSWAVWPH